MSAPLYTPTDNGLVRRLVERLRYFGGTGKQHTELSAPQGWNFVTALSTVHLAANAYYDGTNWNRYDTGAAAAMLFVQTDGAAYISTVAAGANPITWTPRSLALAETTDANGWKVRYDTAGKRRWQKQQKVTSSFPASTTYAAMSAFNLPVGVSNLSTVAVHYSARANTWNHIMNFGYDATDASTGISLNGFIVSGSNWNALGITEVCFDLELVEK